MSTVLAKSMSEKELQDAIVKMAHLFGWRVHHTRTVRLSRKDGSAYHVTPLQGDSGFVDLVLARRGSVIFAELKGHRGRLSIEQEAWITELNGWVPAACPDQFSTTRYGSGGNVTVAVWRPIDWVNGAIKEALS